MQQSRRELVDLPKEYSGDLSFTPKSNNKAFQIISFRPEDEWGVTIPGMTIEIHLRAPLTVGDCKYTFTLFALNKRKRDRVYQLEVVPRDKRSHNDVEKIYGPHEHTPEGVHPVQLELTCESYREWLAIFCDRVNLKLTGALPAPFGNHDEL